MVASARLTGFIETMTTTHHYVRKQDGTWMGVCEVNKGTGQAKAVSGIVTDPDALEALDAAVKRTFSGIAHG